MQEFEEIMQSLTDMRSRFDTGFSLSDRNYIERLYASLLNKTIRKSGCLDCYRDAYLELYHYLKNQGKMPKKPNYVLKAGVVIHPKGTNEFYANTNIPDEVAEKHLAEHPESINDFSVFPADYKARIAARAGGDAVLSVDADELAEDFKSAVAKISQLESELAATKQELDNANAALEEAKAANTAAETSDDDGALSMEVETLRSDLATANEEIAALKKELEEAKAGTTSRRKSAKTSE